MALDVFDVREIVQQVCVRADVIDACRRRDLGTVITILGKHGVTQGRISELTGIAQGRLSEYKTGKRTPRASTTFEDFAEGVGMPPTAREALGLVRGQMAATAAGRRVAGEGGADVGLRFLGDHAEVAGNLTRLWCSDLNDDPSARGQAVVSGAWGDASLAWLVSRERQLATHRQTTGVRIGLADVARFRTTLDTFARLDDKFGGGHVRTALIQYLSDDASRLLRGCYTEAVARDLFSAVAEGTLLAAWMTYDSMPESALAQRYFVQALALSQAGNDRMLGASVLDAMSHQATYTGRYAEAANLARAAAAGTRGIATATLTSHFHVMEARALARLGDAKACDHALAEAVREFERRKPEGDPNWIQYFDDSELAAEFGHCLRDLGRPLDAAQYARRSFPSAAAGVTLLRSDFFAMMVLADVHMDAGNPEEACSVALNALSAGEQIRSARCVNYLRDFRQRLARLEKSRLAVDFNEQAATSRLWRIASQPPRGAA